MTLFDIYIVVVLMVMFWEYKRPKTSISRLRHVYLANILTYFISSLLFYGIIFVIPMDRFLSSQLITFSAPTWFPYWLLLTLQFLLIDLIYYAKHRLDHYIKPLWRWHLVHHSDLHVDVSTSFRHHPFELINSYIFVMLVAWLCGIPYSIMAIYTFISSLIQPLHHANVALPAPLLHFLSLIVITPSVHKVHHSSEQVFTNSNYGNLFPYWDRIFGTYQGNTDLTVFGLEYFREKNEENLLSLFTQPFRYPVQLQRDRRRKNDSNVELK